MNSSQHPHVYRAEQAQDEILRAMSPGRRLQIAQELYETAWQIKAAGCATSIRIGRKSSSSPSCVTSLSRAMLGPEEITRRPEKTGIDYCIVGGLASIAYGRPRLTLDTDLVLAIHPEQVASLIEAFPSADFCLPPSEVMQAELRRESAGEFHHHPSAKRVAGGLLSARQERISPLGTGASPTLAFGLR
jgi:hypothetical protein